MHHRTARSYHHIVVAEAQTLRFTYHNRDFCREVIVRTGEGDGEPTVNANGRLSFDIALKAGQAGIAA